MIVELRSRLHDEAQEGWEDSELLSSINLALSAIARKLRLWKGRWSNTATIGVNRYLLPSDFMSPISFIYDGINVDVKGIEWVMSTPEDEACVIIDNDSLVISPTPTTAAAFVLNYHKNYRVSSTNDPLLIGDEYIDTVLYYALSISHQKQASEESLTQSRYYLGLYREQIQEVQDMAIMRRGSRRTKSTFQRV